MSEVFGFRKHRAAHREVEARIAEFDQKAKPVIERSERVKRYLEDRDRRNHFGETADEIARSWRHKEA